MLRASPPLTVSQASHYYRSEFSRGDYYTERESEGIVASRWHGRGADELGLSGRVKADHFARLLEGKDPLGSEVLVAHREGLDERRAGWDVTVSPHKSVSLTALVGGDSRLLEAHDRAVSKAVAELERHAQAWVHGGRDVVTTGNVIAASFRHETSRALDPQLHSHCVVLNITRRADGEWRAIDARGIFRAQRLGNEIYQAELRKQLLSLGYEVQSYKDGRSGRQRVTGIAGFKDEHLKHFSKRSREIERELKAHGLRSGRHAERVALSTRKTKAKGIDREALLWNWRTAAREAGLVFPKWEKERLVSPGRLDPARERELSARVAVNGARDHLAERRAVFGLSELEREALSRGRDRGVTIDDVRKEIGSRDDLVVADRGDAVVARVTTSGAIEEERALLTAVERGRGRAPTLPSPEQAHGLGEDQVRVARHILGSPDRLVAVEGKAGTGKTKALSYVRERAHAAGWSVRGFAPTTTAAAVLREGGIESITVAAALKESLSLKREPQLWIVDEAGLLSSRRARELLDRAERVGAKVVLVGDRQQHRAVEAGSPFSLLIDRAGIATERLDVIRRQKDEALREVVRVASETGGASRAVQLLQRAGRVVEIPDARLRHEAITRDFIADGGRGVVIAPSNAERQDLNRRIREALIDAGRVEKKSVKAPVVVRQDLTREQRGRASSYGTGDVLRFVRGGQGIEAGERARVISIDERKNLLRLELESSRMVRVINPRHRRAFEVERVEQRRFAVGDRIQFRERDRSLDVANGTLGTIKKLDHERGVATVEVGPRRFRLDLKEPRALDHAYAVTSHRSQGLSRERVYLAVDTSHSEELVNRRQFYVGVSRAVEDARVYTDDRSALSRAVSREQGRESALSVLERVPARETRAATLRRETPLDLVRSSHGRSDGRERGDGRAAGSDRRGADADRGREPLGRGAEGPAGPARGAAGPERDRAAGADRVPGQRDAGATGPGRAAGLEAGPGGGAAHPVLERPRGADAGAAHRGGRAALERDAAARALADGRLAPGDAARGLPGRPGGQLPLWRDGEREAGRDRGDGSRAQEERALGAAPAGGIEREARPGRALSREEIARSAELQRRYAAEYASMLRVVPDRELAKEAARVNVSALASGQPRIVPAEGRVSVEKLRGALGRGGEDLAVIRRAVSRLLDRAAPAIERLPLPSRVRDFGPER
jgi:conjugative relaxase-like TrwC/TraI family protein